MNIAVHPVLTGLLDPRNPRIEGETIQWTWYHEVRLAAAGTTTLFTATAGLNIAQTNWTFGFNRFSATNQFILASIAAEFSNLAQAQAAAAAGEATNQRVVDLLNTCTVDLAIETKEYVRRLPISRLIAGGGLFVAPRSTTVAEVASAHLALGEPYPMAGLSFAPALLIPPLMRFDFFVRLDTALSGGGAIDVRFFMGGWWTRGIQ